MHISILLGDDIGTELLHGIFSWTFLQFLVTFLFAFLFPITSAAVINYLERKVMAWMQDRQGPLHVGPQGSLQLLADIGKLILIPATLGIILLTGLIYLLVIGSGLSSLVFLIVTGVINWVLLFGFIWLVRRATVASTRRAQAPALRARARVQAPLVQLPESVDLAGGGE